MEQAALVALLQRHGSYFYQPELLSPTEPNLLPQAAKRLQDSADSNVCSLTVREASKLIIQIFIFNIISVL